MPLNPDPRYRDPEIEELKSPQAGTIDAVDRFNAAPAGHSLTDAPEQWAWERPPIYTDPEEAMSWVISRIENEEVEENFLRLMLSGIPVEAITNTITFAGFTEGYWTVDMAEILKLPISLHFIGLAIENKIPATMFNRDPEEEKQSRLMPEEQVMGLMRNSRPDMYNKIMYATDLLLEEEPEQPVDEFEGTTLDDVSFMEMEEEGLV